MDPKEQSFGVVEHLSESEWCLLQLTAVKMQSKDRNNPMSYHATLIKTLLLLFPLKLKGFVITGILLLSLPHFN